MLLEIFQQLGFNQKDMQIYLCLNQLGSLKASQIARELEEPKTNILERLYNLEHAGLISRTEQGNSFIFHAEDPEILDYKLAQQQAKLESTRKSLDQVLPELKRHKSLKNLPKVKYFEGRDGIIQLYEDSLKTKNQIYAYGDFDSAIKYLGPYIEEYWQRRTAKKISLIGFVPDNGVNKDTAKATNHLYLRETYFYPPKFQSPVEINIYDDKVFFISFHEEFGALIESKEIAESLRNMLEVMKRGCS